MSARRTLILLLLVLSVSALAATIENVPPSVAGSSPATAVLVGFISAWNNTSAVKNPTITVTQGDVLTIQLSSGDSAVHRFFVDFDKNGPTPDCPGTDICSSLFQSSTTLTFTVNFSPGTYTYYCAVHPTTMLGNFVVLPIPVTGGGGRHLVEM